MLLSEIIQWTKDPNVVEIRNEKPFSRFMRTTSRSEESCCVYINNVKYISSVPKNATMIITTTEIASLLGMKNVGICISLQPKITFFYCLNSIKEIFPNKKVPIIVGKNTYIGKYTSISQFNVRIGNNVIIEDFVKINDNVIIGDNCIIRSGAQLGMQDYNYFEDEKEYKHVYHYGDLILEDNVEIGYNSVVGKALYPGDSTILGAGTKLAPRCGVGHDVHLGKNVLIYSGAIIAGYVNVGDNSKITLGAIVKNGITIGKNVQVNMGSVVIHDIPDGESVFGNPARRMILPE